LTPGGNSTVHIYTQTVHIIQQYSTHLHTNSTHNTAVQYTVTHKQDTEYRERNIHNNKKIGEVWAVPSLYELYPGICLTAEENAQKNQLLQAKLKLERLADSRDKYRDQKNCLQ
jgi:hypothetical protein